MEHLYRPNEPIFGAVARSLVAKGWSVFPQELDGTRRPGCIWDRATRSNRMIRWHDDHNLVNERPSSETVDLWSTQCSSLNVALVLGPASGSTFVIDIDVVDEDTSATIQELAITHLGGSPLRRVGSWPKMALFYRQDTRDPIERRLIRLSPSVDRDVPDPIEQTVEVVATGNTVTFYGKHHRTGRYFHWLAGSPVDIGPESLPLVSSDQMKRFLAAVEERERL